ncbi:MAG: hypothetical protein ACRC0G_08065 [Fusobacteriaceae bacterium]
MITDKIKASDMENAYLIQRAMEKEKLEAEIKIYEGVIEDIKEMI